MTSSSDFYTLVIPTYNRAAHLARLLDYLEREKADFPIVVLDSSEEPARAQNGERVARSHLAIRRVTYPSDVHPFLKVRDGAKQVGSPYCSICADDDIVLLPGLRACVALLDGRREAVAAHGLYFNFHESRFFDLSEVVYRGPSVAAADPLLRLRALFGRYEAPFYAVYRTAVLADIFERVEEMRTTLGRELLTAALTAVAGEILRTTDFYYGRSTAGSFSYDAWHPWQFFTASPQALFDEYRVLRDIVAAAVPPDAGACCARTSCSSSSRTAPPAGIRCPPPRMSGRRSCAAVHVSRSGSRSPAPAASRAPSLASPPERSRWTAS